jgi:hypothetical protein
MTQVNVDKAIDFVCTSGDSILSALALSVAGRMDAEQVLDIIKVYQRNDGGWTKADMDFQGDLSIITATSVALQWLLCAGGEGSAVLEKTVDYLHGAQKSDGAWDEPDEIRHYNPPPWMLPGRYENQVWLTSAIGCKLKELGRERDVDFDRALDFVRRGWDGNRFPVFVHTHWMAMPLFHMQNTGSALDGQIIAGCARFLYEAITNNQVDPGDLISIAYASLLTGDVAADLREISLKGMLDNQMDDGGWKTNYGDKYRAAFTVEALFMLKRFPSTLRASFV